MTFEGWIDGIPPLTWPRMLAMDVGGATPNNLEWAAQDPQSLCIVFYDEVNKTTTDMRELAQLAIPKMKHPSGEEYNFKFRVGDYENRIALEEMGKHGLRFTNAVKTNKNLSIHRLAGYLHPNPKRPYPQWHPNAGRLGSPLMFVTPRCAQLIKEIPLQRWKEDKQGGSRKDELDKTVRHDAVDCALYIARLLPAPVEIPIPKAKEGPDMDLRSKLYWEDVRRRKEQLTGPERRKYNPSHMDSGGIKWDMSQLLS